jgi:hypothetical protein
MAQTALIPAWVAPAARAVADCHWIAHATGQTQVVAVMDWVTCDLPDPPDVLAQLAGARGGAYDTLAWLLGMSSRPPITLPRRNPDDTVMTAAQLYDEYMTGLWGEPEQRRDAQLRAVRDAAAYQRLANLVPH